MMLRGRIRKALLAAWHGAESVRKVARRFGLTCEELRGFWSRAQDDGLLPQGERPVDAAASASAAPRSLPPPYAIDLSLDRRLAMEAEPADDGDPAAAMRVEGANGAQTLAAALRGRDFAAIFPFDDHHNEPSPQLLRRLTRDLDARMALFGAMRASDDASPDPKTVSHPSGRGPRACFSGRCA